METRKRHDYGSLDELKTSRRGEARLIAIETLCSQVFPDADKKGSLERSINYIKFSNLVKSVLKQFQERKVIEGDPELVQLVAEEAEDRIGPSIFGEGASDADRASRVQLVGEITPKDIPSIVDTVTMISGKHHLLTQD